MIHPRALDQHGIARRPGPGSIDISARRVDGTLELSVTDDGPGPPDALTPGIGLSNTRERLDRLYGDASAFTLDAAPGGGARAGVRIPFRE